jgi:predicted DNA-binding antitoxin AbrB/MazE fold protein
MLEEFDAIYENGVLRPLEPLPLTEHSLVRVSLAVEKQEAWLDYEYRAACAAEADFNITHEEVRAALAVIPGSMDEAIDIDRGEY